MFTHNLQTSQGQPHVTKAIMIESRGYDQQWLRPYQTEYNGTVSQQIMESTNYGQQIDSDTLSPVATSFLRPRSSVTQGDASFIDSGYNEPRFSFLIEFTFEEPGTRARQRHIVNGYTDRLDYSMSGYLAPDMKLRFNSIISIRDVVEPTPTGDQMRSIPTTMDHVLTGLPLDDPMGYNAGPRYELSPDKVLHHIGINQDPSLTGIEEQGSSVIMRNMSPTISGIHLVPRRYECRSNYLSDSITQYRSAVTDVRLNDTEGTYNGFSPAETFVEQDPAQVAYQKASANLRGTATSQHGLYRHLSAMNPDFQRRGYMTYQELCELFPELDQQLVVMFLGQQQLQTTYQPGMGEHWHGSNHETMAATIIQQTLPSILTNCLTQKMSFWATNDVVGGQHYITYYEPPEGFVAGLDFVSQFKEYFESRLINEVLNDISRYGNLIYHIDVRINLLREAHIRVSIDNQEPIYFVTPLFCDSAFAPLVTSRGEDIGTLANDIDVMLNDVTGQSAHTPMSSAGQPGSILQQVDI